MPPLRRSIRDRRPVVPIYAPSRLLSLEIEPGTNMRGQASRVPRKGCQSTPPKTSAPFLYGVRRCFQGAEWSCGACKCTPQDASAVSVPVRSATRMRWRSTWMSGATFVHRLLRIMFGSVATGPIRAGKKSRTPRMNEDFEIPGIFSTDVGPEIRFAHYAVCQAGRANDELVVLCMDRRRGSLADPELVGWSFAAVEPEAVVGEQRGLTGRYSAQRWAWKAAVRELRCVTATMRDGGGFDARAQPPEMAGGGRQEAANVVDVEDDVEGLIGIEGQ
ncbi:hypothetical protein C8R45DRAFT_926276 [Mycena sanguinolenta]|nr:hypothetical protein C8R45DRAFT_926276 [Mycena sanguinolenta]